MVNFCYNHFTVTLCVKDIDQNAEMLAGGITSNTLCNGSNIGEQKKLRRDAG